MSGHSSPLDTFCWITVKHCNAHNDFTSNPVYGDTIYFFLQVWGYVFQATHDQFTYKISGRVCFHECDFPRV